MYRLAVDRFPLDDDRRAHLAAELARLTAAHAYAQPVQDLLAVLAQL